MKIRFTSATYEVVAKGKSKARYAEGIEVGDLVEFSIEKLAKVHYRNGRYATYIDMYVNSKLHTTISQGELGKVVDVLELKEVLHG